MPNGGTMRSDTSYVPHRGDVIWIDLDPRVGHEQSGKRPALVISADISNVRLAVICPITSRVKGLLFETPLVGTKTHGVVLAIHVRSIDFSSRGAKFIERVPKQLVDDVAKKVSVIIGAQP